MTLLVNSKHLVKENSVRSTSADLLILHADAPRSLPSPPSPRPSLVHPSRISCCDESAKLSGQGIRLASGPNRRTVSHLSNPSFQKQVPAFVVGLQVTQAKQRETFHSLHISLESDHLIRDHTVCFYLQFSVVQSPEISYPLLYREMNWAVFHFNFECYKTFCMAFILL